MSHNLERAIQRFRRTPSPDGVRRDGTSRNLGNGFRAVVETRIAGLERDISELKNRLNGLIFVVIGAVITQVILKVIQ